MMYHNKLAVALKSAGRVLREFKDTVYVPFGTEYSILIKNLNSVRASVTVSIDGTDATENVSLIIDPNKEIELTRFIKNGNLNEGNRFKFIERTSTIEQHRGIGVEDGLIRIEFEFERQPQPLVQNDWWNQRIGSPLCGSPVYGHGYSTCDAVAKGTLGSVVNDSGPQLMNASKGTLRSRSLNACNATLDSIPIAQSFSAQSFNDAGITVPGSVSDQKFSTVYGFRGNGVKEVIVMKLLGEDPMGQPIVQPITVKVKPTCVTCGKVNKATASYCSHCGTALNIV